MTTLQLVSEQKKTFKSLGCMDHLSGEYKESSLFPKETIVQLTEGKFPLTDYKDLHEHSGLFYKMNNIQLKLLGFCISCVENNVEKYGDPILVVSEI